MFTGIIDHKAKVLEVKPRGERGATYLFQTRFDGLTMGESIAVDGVCLTVAEKGENRFSADLSPETLRLSTLQSKQAGDLVNVERALRMGDAMGGHWVTGHVDATGRCESVTREGDFLKMVYSYPETFRPFVTPKGSITVNGVSLTINMVEATRFSVMLIPHTAERTNLGTLRETETVNLEFDWMSKIIVQQLKERLERQAT